ncbi:hypothetical protein GOODEAATRI_030506, partial [Goodea atripinnis]
SVLLIIGFGSQGHLSVEQVPKHPFMAPHGIFTATNRPSMCVVLLCSVFTMFTYQEKLGLIVAL